MHILPPSQDERMARGKDGFGFKTIHPSISGDPRHGKYGEVDHPPIVRSCEVLRALCRHKLDHSRPRLLVNLRDLL